MGKGGILNRVDCRRSETKIKNTQNVKQDDFNQTKQDRMQIFEGILVFKTTQNTKTNQSAAAS